MSGIKWLPGESVPADAKWLEAKTKQAENTDNAVLFIVMILITQEQTTLPGIALPERVLDLQRGN
jgi:hypothetical protein